MLATKSETLSIWSNALKNRPILEPFDKLKNRLLKKIFYTDQKGELETAEHRFKEPARYVGGHDVRVRSSCGILSTFSQEFRSFKYCKNIFPFVLQEQSASLNMTPPPKKMEGKGRKTRMSLITNLWNNNKKKHVAFFFLPYLYKSFRKTRLIRQLDFVASIS